jgi:hypothetical protein
MRPAPSPPLPRPAQVYLDALGVAATSPRRASHQGINWAYRLNPGTRQAVDLVLLDGRYERAPLPCEVRGDWWVGHARYTRHTQGCPPTELQLPARLSPIAERPIVLY